MKNADDDRVRRSVFGELCCKHGKFTVETHEGFISKFHVHFILTILWKLFLEYFWVFKIIKLSAQLDVVDFENKNSRILKFPEIFKLSD